MTGQARLLTGTELRGLSVRSDLRGALRLGVHLLLVGVGVWLVARAGIWTMAAAMLLLGVAQAALFAPLHETMHLTAFASRRTNAVVGWLVACPSLLNWHYYAAFHLAHHRHTQDPERDPELIGAPDPTTRAGYVLRMLGVAYWRTRLAVLRDGWRGDLSAYPFISVRLAPRIIQSLRWMTVLLLAGSGLSMVLVGWWAPLVFWIAPQLLGQPLLRLYLLTEHTWCTLDDNGLTNTRTTLTNAAVRTIMWNMGFHAEHHLYPSIPFHRLPAAHLMIRDRLGVLQIGYARWHRAFLGSLRG